MRTLEELTKTYLCTSSNFYKRVNPEPFLYKKRMLNHLMTDELTLEEFDILTKHYQQLKKDWMESKKNFKACLMGMSPHELSNTTISQRG
ncbi:hypothetical protein RA178_06195 [Shewanella oncorhynchi]|uniref:Uncharacterized protein n=1 Tax=Shewanella oncorhynchi TaxID=2726434 RepID=A0AA50KFU2_9GAMM|nr:hypothetical protein [Shewanella oncorhynchi]WMB74202.1 hypothetical protein RA178_06195 [Shewanella oncorhynchi]